MSGKQSTTVLLLKYMPQHRRCTQRTVKAGVHAKAVLTSLNTAFLPISRSRFKQRLIFVLITITTIWRFCVNIWMVFWHFGKEITFLKGYVKLGKIWNADDLMDLENWNLNWRVSRQIPNSPLPTWGSLFFFSLGGGGQLPGSFSNPF